MTSLSARAVLAATVALALTATPVYASRAHEPGVKPPAYIHWSYPNQLSYGAIERGASDQGRSQGPNAFLTLPFMGPHYVTSIFDHCSPDYTSDGRVCRYDGAVATEANGPDPGFTAGYSRTPQGTDYLYYDGHDGYDYGLTFEPVAAAAPGRVTLADWYLPNCHECLSGLTILINHGNGLQTYYGHLSELMVSKGDFVRRGQVIGISGSSGTATGPHLHFGVYLTNGRGPVDPYGWSGVGPDPYPRDVGDLWLSGSPRYADIPLPAVTAVAVRDPEDPTAMQVSWSSPGEGDLFDISVREGDAVVPWLTGQPAGSALFKGKIGGVYFFWVSVVTNLGWTDAQPSNEVRIASLNVDRLS